MIRKSLKAYLILLEMSFVIDGFIGPSSLQKITKTRNLLLDLLELAMKLFKKKYALSRNMRAHMTFFLLETSITTEVKGSKRKSINLFNVIWTQNENSRSIYWWILETNPLEWNLNWFLNERIIMQRQVFFVYTV